MDLQKIIQTATEIGKRTGFITFDQLNELCPKELESEDIETLLTALGDQGIQVTDDSNPKPGLRCAPSGLRIALAERSRKWRGVRRVTPNPSFTDISQPVSRVL